jgi:phosphoserine phosphatase RsbU/P
VDRPPSFQITRWVLGLVVLLTLAGQILEAERAPHVPSSSMGLRDNRVVSLIPGGAAERAGIRVGDLIVGLGDQVVPAGRSAARLLAYRTCGDTMGIALLRGVGGDDAPRQLEVPFVPPRPLRIEVLWRLALAGVATATLLVGFLVFYRKPRGLSLIFAGVCYGMGYLIYPPYVPLAEPALLVRDIVFEAVTVFIPPLLVHLFLLFPFRHPILQRRPRLPLLLYVPSLVLLASFHALRLLTPGATAGGAFLALGQQLALVVWIVGCGTALWLFVRSYRRAQTETARAQVRVVLWGTVLGISPAVFVLVLRQVRPTFAIPGDRLVILATVLVPLSFGYAIVRHGIFDATHLVRRSLVLAGGGGLLLLAYFGAYMLLEYVLLPKQVSMLLISFLSMLAAGILFWLIQGRLRVLLRRAAGEERREQPRLLHDLGQELRGVGDRGELVRIMTGILREALRSERVAFCEWVEGGGLDVVYVEGMCADQLSNVRLSRNLAQALAEVATPIDRGDLEMDLPFGYLSPGDQQILGALSAEMLVPVRAAHGIVGIFLVGGQTLGEPFDAADRQLAETIATEGGVALENATLQDRVRREEQLRREVDSAGDLQRRLLPAQLPQVDSFEISGFSIPAQGVGGDYYDCFRTQWGEIVLAIGDAAGKSVSGAILMANLQGLVKSEAQRRDPPPEIVARINRRLCEMRKPDRYVTFCLARVDPLTGTLAYSNAGHPSLLLVRADGETEELQLGGLPLGIRPQAEYEGGSTYMRAGDVLLAYTDGISERQRGDELFGADRLREIARVHRRKSTRALQEAILAAVRDFAPTPLDDDTTLLLVKML